jgi:hypothetical protein
MKVRRTKNRIECTSKLSVNVYVLYQFKCYILKIEDDHCHNGHKKHRMPSIIIYQNDLEKYLFIGLLLLLESLEIRQ